MAGWTKTHTLCGQVNSARNATGWDNRKSAFRSRRLGLYFLVEAQDFSDWMEARGALMREEFFDVAC